MVAGRNSSFAFPTVKLGTASRPIPKPASGLGRWLPQWTLVDQSLGPQNLYKSPVSP